MLLKSHRRTAAIFGLFAVLSVQCPVRAQLAPDVYTPGVEKENRPAIKAEEFSAANQIEATENASLIAQASGSTAGSDIANVALAGASLGKKQKGELLITDSLWGNLILDLAYQRDPELRQIAKRLNLVNLGTMVAITGIAGGTLTQGIITLATLNPPPPKSDSYLPGGLGVGFAGLTLVTFAARTAINQVLAKQLRNRQLEIKHKVESILSRIESTQGEDPEARSDLIALVGQRATNEWLQLWRSSNVIASLKQPKVSLGPSDLLVGHRP
jgi:hypothetical protein